MADAEKKRYLPADFTLKLTALELGALGGIVFAYRAVFPEQAKGFPVNVEGREEPVLMIDRLMEKIEAAIKGG